MLKNNKSKHSSSPNRDIKYLSQEKARFIFEELTGLAFPLTRKALDGRLELDGYCNDLKIAFEYNGEQHYDPQHYYNLLQNKKSYDSQMVRDQRKRKICKKKGITLIEIRHKKEANHLESHIYSVLVNLGVAFAKQKVIWTSFNCRTSSFHKANRILNDKNITLLTPSYLGSHSRHQFKCSKCNHQWEAVLKDVLYKSNCPKCAGSIKYTLESIQDMAKNANLEMISNVYTSMLKKHKFQCKKCDYIWSAKPNQIQQGQGCPSCAGNTKITSSKFCHLLNKKNIKLLGKYSGLNKKYEFICNACQHKWVTLAANIWNKTGCPPCSNDKKKINIADLRRLASKRSLNLLSTQCMGYHVKHMWECLHCGKKYSLKPCNVQRGTSCRSCKTSRKEVQ